jgi:hypothetical protein
MTDLPSYGGIRKNAARTDVWNGLKADLLTAADNKATREIKNPADFHSAADEIMEKLRAHSNVSQKWATTYKNNA